MDKFYTITNKSFDEYGVTNHRDLWSKVQKEFKGFSMQVNTTFEKSVVQKEGKDETIWTMVFSTPDKDRHGDIMVQNWYLEPYKLNPVLLDSHNYDSITRIIGRVINIRVENEQLKGELEFAVTNPLGQLAKEMVEGGFINTSSVGFIPLEFDNDGRILKSELLENSLVSVPANARALFEKKVDEVTADIKQIKQEMVQDMPVADIVIAQKTIDVKKETLKSIVLALKSIEDFEARDEEVRTIRSIKIALGNILNKEETNEAKRRKVVRYIHKALRTLI